MLEIFAVVGLSVACLWAIASPFLRPSADGTSIVSHDTASDAAKESKYREIRDAEADYRSGKLTEEEWQAVDADLRAEATEILDNQGSSDASRA